MGRQQQQADLIERMKCDPATFRKYASIDVGGKVVPLRTVIKPWQQRDFEALDSTWLRAIGRPYRGKVYDFAAMLRGRGCSKTADVGLSSLWAIWAAPRPVLIIVASGSRDQASLVIRSVRRHCQAMPWIDGITIRQNRITSKNDGEILVLPADAGLTMGHIATAILCDEIVHWADASGEAFWHTMVSTAAKMETCPLFILTNSGVLGSWQHKVIESLRQSDDCYHSSTNETETLLSPKQLEAQRRILPPSVFDRLFNNIFVAAAADGLGEEELNACIKSYSPYPMDRERASREGWIFLAGADLSARKDHSAVSVVAVHGPTQKIRVAWTRRWVPRNGKIDLLDVNRTIHWVNDVYKPMSWHLDNFEGYRQSQELHQRGVMARIESMQGRHSAVKAAALLSAVNNQQLEIHECETKLIQDFRSIAIVEKNGVLSIVADHTSRGHCDQAFSVICMLPTAQELCTQRYCSRPGISITKTEIDPGRHGVLLEHRSMSSQRLAVGQDPLAGFRQRARGERDSGWRRVE